MAKLYSTKELTSFYLIKEKLFLTNFSKKNKSKLFLGFLYLFVLIFSFNELKAQTFTDNAPGTRNFTVPCDVTSITIQAWGAGGAGGAADNNPNGGSGGGGGGYSTYTVTVTPGQIIPYTVGTRGNGGGGNGGNATATTILAITANGGTGGGQNQGAFGTGGSAIGGAINGGIDIPGGNGAFGTLTLGAAGGTCNALAGGASRNTTGNGIAATNPGSGGGGALRVSGGGGRNGGNGRNGQITITYTIISPYCLPTFTNAIEPITNVTFAGINNTTSATVGGTPSLDVFCSSSATVVQGSSYNEISIKGNTDGAFEDFFKAYIDWDQNGVFGNNPNEIYSLGSILNSTGVDAITLISSISVPSGALLGNTKMRVMKRYGGYPNDPCQTGVGYGQAEDYIVNVIAQTPCITPTTQPTALILTPVGQSIGGTFTHAAPRPNQYLVVISTSNIAPTPANGTTYSIGDSVGAGYTVVDIDANNNFNAGALNLSTTYYFYIFSFNSACTGGPLYRNVLPLTGNATTPAVPTGYCTPATTSVATDRLYVTNVDFVGTMLDQSTASTTDTPADGYQDWTTRPKSIQAQGGAINMKLSSNSVRGFWKVWVDWNKDGDFLDSGEEVYNPGGFLFSSTTFGFIIPSYTPVGDYRIRVRVQNTYRNFDGAETLVDFNSCNSFGASTIGGFGHRTYGEAEDYLFTVIPKCDNIITSINNPAICGAISGSVSGMVSANISATSTSGSINWYDALTGGTLLGNTASGANWTTPSISTSTTYYATAFGSCESLVRTPVFVEVKPVPALIIATPNVTVCGENSIIQLDATGDDEVAYLINENFETGTLGVFTNINSDATSATDKTKTAWKNKSSIFVPAGARWFPAITSGFGTNKFVLTSFDDFSGSFPTVPMENSLTLSNSVNSTGFVNLTLSFRMFYSRYYADGANTAVENCKIEVSTNGGGTWTTIPGGSYTADQGYGSNFITVTFPMSGYINQTNLKIRVKALGDGTATGLAGDGVAIDDVKLFGDRPLIPFFALGGGVDGFYDATAITTPYDGQPANTIYIRPTLTQLEQPSFSINVSSNLNNGCITSGIINVTNNTKIWKGTTSSDWNTASNWAPAIVPTITNCVIIPTAVPNPTTLSTGLAGSGKNLTIKNGGILEIQSGNALTIKEIVDVNTGSTFNIKNNSSLVQIDNITNIGNINMERIVNLKLQDYSYWSSPVGIGLAGTFPVQSVSPLTPAGYIFKWGTTTTNTNGGEGNWINTAENMIPSKGYIVRAPSGFNNTSTSALTTNFIGIPNNGVYSPTIFRGNDYSGIGLQGIPRTATDDNWNLIGNPYPSSIGVNEFLTLPANSSIQGFVKIWTHGQLPANTTSPFYQNFASNYYPSDYISVNLTGATSGPGDYKIGAGQGFMVLMNPGAPSSSTVTFDNAMRSATFVNNQFYKNGNVTSLERNRIWLDLVTSTGSVNRTVVGYIDGATHAEDRLYDAFTDNKPSQNFYSLIDNKPMVIQGRALPFDVNDTVPMGVQIPTNGTYTIAIAAVDGLFSGGDQTIYLEDKLLNTIHNLTASQYQFTSNQGIINNRFVLRYTTNALSNTDFDYSNEVKIFANNCINISSINQSIKEVIIYDVLGKVLIDKKGIGKKEISLNQLKPTTNVLIVKVILDNNGIIIKKVVF